MSDLVAAMADPDHERLVTEHDAHAALEVAVKATRMARESADDDEDA
jgi:hypothetical protein